MNDKTTITMKITTIQTWTHSHLKQKGLAEIGDLVDDTSDGARACVRVLWLVVVVVVGLIGWLVGWSMLCT